MPRSPSSCQRCEIGEFRGAWGNCIGRLSGQLQTGLIEDGDHPMVRKGCIGIQSLYGTDEEGVHRGVMDFLGFLV